MPDVPDAWGAGREGKGFRLLTPKPTALPSMKGSIEGCCEVFALVSARETEQGGEPCTPSLIAALCGMACLG